MFRRAVFAISIALITGAATVFVWSTLNKNNEDQVAKIIEAESYAARSQLVQRVERFLLDLRDLRLDWEQYERTGQPTQAGTPAAVLEQYSGILTVLWQDSDRHAPRAYTLQEGRLEYRGLESDWSGMKPLLDRSDGLAGNSLVGPFVREDGRTIAEIHLVNPRRDSYGRLVVVLDTQQLLHTFLAEESPGYAIRVLAGDTKIYERDNPAPDVPESWVRQGLIKTSMNTLWTVVHSPTDELLASYADQGADAALALGLLMSAVLGALFFEHDRAKSRASAAEQAEHALAELNRDLEQEIAIRTRELAARTADLQTLADSVAHDLRNPLNNISVNIQVLEQGYADSVSAEAMKIISRLAPDVQRMADILNRLLGLTKVSHSTFSRETVDMQSLVETTFRNIASAEQRAKVDFRVVNLPDAFADRKLTEILLHNLLSNALKYGLGSINPRIEVFAERHADATVYVVKDNGKGFDKEAAKDIFASFERADQNDSAGGLGLGLAIASKVVQRHEGRIWARSEPGEGAAFFFTLEPGPADSISDLSTNTIAATEQDEFPQPPGRSS